MSAPNYNSCQNDIDKTCYVHFPFRPKGLKNIIAMDMLLSRKLTKPAKPPYSSFSG